MQAWLPTDPRRLAEEVASLDIHSRPLDKIEQGVPPIVTHGRPVMSKLKMIGLERPHLGAPWSPRAAMGLAGAAEWPPSTLADYVSQVDKALRTGIHRRSGLSAQGRRV
jgi:hypothetical protein